MTDLYELLLKELYEITGCQDIESAISMLSDTSYAIRFADRTAEILKLLKAKE